jgi:hypothetical protein
LGLGQFENFCFGADKGFCTDCVYSWFSYVLLRDRDYFFYQETNCKYSIWKYFVSMMFHDFTIYNFTFQQIPLYVGTVLHLLAFPVVSTDVVQCRKELIGLYLRKYLDTAKLTVAVLSGQFTARYKLLQPLSRII